MAEETTLTIFDYYRNIIKKEPMFSKEEVENSYDILGMNRLFSYDKSNVLLANEVNNFRLSKWALYQFYYYAVNKKDFVPFLNMKKEKNDEKILLMKKAQIIFPEYSNEKLEEVIVILKHILADVKLEDLTYKGGIEKGEKK